MDPYPFQNTVAHHILQGRSVVLQAPTGAGKTRAALIPYIDARFQRGAADFPRRCVYSVPLRVLASQFHAEYHALFDHYTARFLSLEMPTPQVTIQMGERAEDRKFEGDLIFTTIDQALSSFLAIPFALSNREANLNAAAIFGSYLVFDEFHLFPAETDGSGALGTTLEMLQWLRGITPFVLMTATFSSTMLDRLCALLGAEKVVLSADELVALPSQHKTRSYSIVDAELAADAVLAVHRERSIVVCNTVARAQELYRQLRDDPRRAGIAITLLHSRFLKGDRDKKEEWVRREFGKDRSAWQEKRAILVATQVVEVGLDITCEHLHTELAPANSIFQRAGRCARYEGEEGYVHVYRLPLDDAGQPAAAPYSGALCAATWEALASRNGAVLDFGGEQKVVDAVHTAEDERLLDLLASSQGRLRQQMDAAIGGPDRSTARELASGLIRNVDNITVVVHPGPNPDTAPNPWAFEGFSLFRYSVQNERRVQELLDRAAELGLEQALWVPELLPDATEDIRQPPRYNWRVVTNPARLAGTQLVFVHPQLTAYDEALGFRFVLNGDDTYGNFVSPELKRGREQWERHGYRPETYKQHIAWLWKVYLRTQRDQVAWLLRRLEEQLKAPKGTLDWAIRLTLACHDAGKLTEGWQVWAHTWQSGVGQPISNSTLVAHTFFDPRDPRHQALAKALDRKRPHHAVEGAMIVGKLVYGALDEEERLARPVLSAIARHHSADSAKACAFQLDPYARGVLQEVLDLLGTSVSRHADTALLCRQAPDMTLTERIGLVPQGARLEQLLYFLLVRVLRLCDGKAVAWANAEDQE